MELFLLYIWLKLGSLYVLLIALSIFTILSTFFMAIAVSDSEDDEQESWVAMRNISAKLAVTFILCATLLPSKTDVAILVGANYALKAAETPEAQKVMTILRAKANEILDAEIKEQVK